MTNLSDKLVVDPGVRFRVFAIISEDRERFHRAYRKVVFSTSIVGLPFFAAMLLMAPELLLVMYGPQWTASIVPLQLLCVVGALRVASGSSSVAILARGYAWVGFVAPSCATSFW